MVHIYLIGMNKEKQYSEDAEDLGVEEEVRTIKNNT